MCWLATCQAGLLLHQLGEEVNVEDGAYETDEREDDDAAANDAVDYYHARLVKLGAYLVYHPRQPIPPQQRAAYHGGIAHGHEHGLVGYDEVELGKEGYEEQDYQGVGQGDEECRHRVVDQCAFLFLPVDMGVFQRVAEETDETENEKHHAAGKLQVELVYGVVDEIYHKRHARPGDQGIKQVACRGSYACGESIPASFLLGPLNAKYSHGTHWRGSRYANDDAFDDKF